MLNFPDKGCSDMQPQDHNTGDNLHCTASDYVRCLGGLVLTKVVLQQSTRWLTSSL